MLKFYADYFVRLSASLARLPHIVRNLKGWETVVHEELLNYKEECERTGFKQLARQAQRIINHVPLNSLPEELYADRRKKVEVLLGELFDSIVSKLESCLFLSIDRDKIGFYATDDIPHFGKDVDKAIPKSTYHVAEAGRCYALERWDACVHHLMLAVEEALRKWACNLKLKMDRPLILSNWESILNAARTRLMTLKN